MDLNGGLPVSGGREHLGLLCRDGRVALDQPGKDVAFGLKAQRQGRYIQQEHVLHLAAQNTRLDGSANGHALIGVDALEGFLAGHVLHSVLHGGDTGGTADQNDAVDLGGSQAGIFQRGLHRADGTLHQIGGQLIELRAGQGDVKVLGAVGVGGDEGQVDVGGHDAGQVNLGFLGGFLQALPGHAVLLQVNAVFFLEDFGDVVDHAVVKVVAAQLGVAVGGQHFKHAIADFQDGHVKGAAAQVIHQDLVGFFLVKAIGQGGRGGLVDDAQDFQARDAAGVLGGLALGVGEVGGHGDDGLVDRLAQVAFSVLLQLLQHHGGDFLGGVVLAVHGELEVGAHLALDGRDGALRVGDGLALGDLANQALAFFGKGNDGRRGPAAFGIGDHNRLAAFHDSDTGVGGTKVNTDNFSHECFLQ